MFNRQRCSVAVKEELEERESGDYEALQGQLE